MRRILVLSCSALLAMGAAARAEAPRDDPHDAAAEVLPSPPALTPGVVPLTEPLAPVPPGAPDWEVAAFGGAGLFDAFWSKLALSVSLRRSLGIVSLDGFGSAFLSDARAGLRLCTAPGVCGPPDRDKLLVTPGRLAWMGGAGVALRAAEGKVSFAGLEAVRFSFDGALGLAAVGHLVEDGDATHRIGPGARLLLGLQAQLAHGLSARVELASVLYGARVRRAWSAENQVLLGAGLSWSPGGGAR